MKKGVFSLLFCFLLMGCNQKSVEEKIENLNGYWEIKTAELPDGKIKEYRISSVVDYIEIEDSEGFRKKMQPQFDGGFLTSDDVEMIQVKVENDSINLYYTTAYNSWKETLLSSEEDEIEILNEDGIIYTYKRFTPYSLEDDKEK
ncbi:MAG TPA: hypothetical protein VFM59_04340 [Salinimicrobium sp.]|nr:hypothetical protein [Salinimicrobium sp.]